MKNILRNSNFSFTKWCVVLAAAGWMGASSAKAQNVYWDFANANPTSGVPSGISVGAVSQGNNNGTTAMLGTTSPSSGYTGASGTSNAGAAARIGVLNTASSGSAYFEFTVTPNSGFSSTITAISFGSRETGTGPKSYSLRSSVDSYASDLTTGTLGANSTWTLRAITGLSINRTVATTYRIYGYGGLGSASANTANWRIDDLSISITAQQLSSGTPVITSSVTPSGTAYATFTYQIAADNSPTSFGATGLPSQLNINTTNGQISGTITTPGDYSFTVSATNGSGTGSANVTLTMTKNSGAPTISSLLTAAATAGSVFSYQIVASNTPTSFTSGTLPAGLTLDLVTGIISGTPTAGGVSNITITALNNLGQDSQTLVLTTSATPTITSSTSGSLYEGGTFSYTIAATATPAVTVYGATGLPAGLSIDTETGIIGGSVSTAGTYSFTVSADNSVGTGTATYALRVLSQAEQDAIPLSVVVNKYVNATPDRVELLVVGNGTVGSTVDMRGMIIKDHGSSMAVDEGGKFVFANNSLWASVPAGTLIVLTTGTTETEDITVGGGDFNLAVNLGNSTYFTTTGGFDIATTEMVMIKAAGTGVNGVAGGIHALAGGTAGARYTEFTGKKLRTSSTSGTSIGIYANNANSVLADYYLADGTGATGNVAQASLSFGSFNTAGNDSFIKTLRGVVDGTGLVSIVNGLSGSRYQGQNVFPRNELGQTVEIVFTPSSTTTAIQQLEIDVPALFGVPSLTNVTLTGTGTGTATVGVAGQKVTISGMSAVSPNPVTIKIAGLSTPDTSASVSNNGAYSFAIRSAGSGGSLASLGVSPIARVMIPIANLKNVDSTSKIPVLNGQTVAVEGVCLVGRLGSGNTYTVLQEGTAGVQVYSLSVVQGPQTRGNKYAAVGTVGQNFGITQIIMTDASLMFDQGADVLPTPTVVSIPVFNAAGEDYENRLIRIENLTYVSGTFANGQNVVFQDANSVPVTVRIQSASTATAKPNGTVTITGIGGQFDSSSPYNTGYQLQPRDIDDMPAPPSITTTTFAGTVGEDFSAKIASVGSPAITAGAGLPVGLSLDSAGFITGTPEAAATSGLAVSFTAINAYGSTSASITFTIAKGTPTIVTPPTASDITEGQTLVASTFTGGSVTGIASTALSGTFGWSSPTFAPPLGTTGYGVVFTPSGADANNWNVSSSTTVSVTVNAAPEGTSYSSWLGTADPSDAAFLDYVFGAVTPGTLDASLKPTVAVTGGYLVLTYYVREGTVGLTVTPKTSSDLALGAGGWSTAEDVAEVATTTVNGVSVRKHTARVLVSGVKKFLRVQAVQE